jgi:hypothetical protein
MTSEPQKTETPPVDPSDLVAAWTAVQTFQSLNNPGGATSIDSRSLEQVCSPDADVHAVWTRTVMLEILTHVMPAWMERANKDKVFEVAARFPMKLTQPGMKQNEPPFDMREFMKQIAAR